MKHTLLFAVAVTLALTLPASAKNFTARAYCPMTHVIGFGHGSTLAVAKKAATAECIRKGGIPSCCNKFVRQIIR